MKDLQLNFGSEFIAEGKRNKIGQWKIRKFKSDGTIGEKRNFMDLMKGDIFEAYDEDTGEKISHENGASKFLATSDIKRDMLGIPCIDISTDIENA